MSTKVRRGSSTEQDETRFVARLQSADFVLGAQKPGSFFVHTVIRRSTLPKNLRSPALRSVHGREALPLPAHTRDIRALLQRFDQRGIFSLIRASAP